LEAVNRNPKKVAYTYIEENNSTREVTYEEAEAQSNQLANLLRVRNVKKGDVVVLMMDNRPEFLISWLAIAKVGATTALINTHLKGKPLIHSLVTSKASIFLIGSEHTEAIDAVREEAKASQDPVLAPLRGNDWFVSGAEVPGYFHLDPLVRDQLTYLVGGLPRDRSLEDVYCYIYTSGTTGLPKASVITHLRYLMTGISMGTLFDMSESDVYYCALPFYHSAGGMICVSCAMFYGMKLVFRKKFSASRFWADCAENGVTIVQYIGELCSYLLDKEVVPQEAQHNIRLAVGNGLRPDIWPKFQSRFAIPLIGEFYAATEGNANLVNFNGRPGAVGFVPRVLDNIYTARLVKYDVESDNMIKNKDGFCVEAEVGEPGHLLGKIVEGDPAATFKGYTSKEATESKILRNVFQKGDAWFMTGDLLRKDPSGYYYFVDRIGDTFRWKGENVATGEVEIVLRSFPQIREVTVYGVQVPHAGGRAGMAVIVPTCPVEEFDFSAFYAFARSQLPAYAVPIFLRFDKEIEITGTFKHMKASLRKQGFDPQLIKEPLYISDGITKSYVPLTPALFAQIQEHSLPAKL